MKILIALAGVIIFFNSIALAEVPPPGRRDSARHLIIQLNNNYNFLDKELKKLEEDIKVFPRTTLHLSAVNKAVNSDIKLLSIEAQDNDKLIESHIYSALENEALAAGGRQQLYQGEVREGEHVLKVTYYWTEEDGPPQKGETYITFSMLKGMTYSIELSLTEKGNNVVLDSSQFEFINR